MIERPDNIRAGILLTLAAMFFFVALDSLAKYLMVSYPVSQVVWGRFFFHTCFVGVALLCMGNGRSRYLVSRKPGLQLWRSVLMLATNGLFFLAISTVDLITATTIMFLFPIVVTILAIPVLGEQVGWRRWISVVVGFVGALIIIRPGILQIDFAILILLLATVTHAFYQLFTRKVRIYDEPITSLLYTGLVGTIIMSVVVPFEWQAPDLAHWPLFVMMGLCGSVGHFCLIRALRAAPASVISPLNYTTLIWATGFSYVLFDELPDAWVYAGAAVIIGSGLYILHREQRVSSQAPSVRQQS